MNKLMYRICNYILVIGFFIALLVFTAKSLPVVWEDRHEALLAARGFDALSSEITALQNDYKENLWKKQLLTDVASLCDRLLGRRYGDNYHYYRQGDMMYAIGADWDYSNILVENFVTLSKKAAESDDDAVFIYAHQTPRKEMETLPECVPVEDGSAREYGESKALMEGTNIVQYTIPVEDTVYFHTDMHNTTESQVAMIRDIVSEFQARGVYFPDLSALDIGDPQRYEAQHNVLLGGYGRSVGKGFVGVDDFTKYFPKNESAFYVYTYDTGQEFRGTMKEVLVRQVEDPGNRYHYHVTDCGFYGHSAYVIVNDMLPEGPKLVVTMDSVSLTGINYLAGVCSQVLVLDPRFDTGGVCEMALESAKGVYDGYLLYYIADSMVQYPILTSEE